MGGVINRVIKEDIKISITTQPWIRKEYFSNLKYNQAKRVSCVASYK